MYGSSQTKSWLPYEWLDCADRLHYDGLSLNRCWFSKLKNEFVLLLSMRTASGCSGAGNENI